MSKKVHPLHFAIAEQIERNLHSNCLLIKDTACGGFQHIPLFNSRRKSRKTQYGKVDLLILKDEKIKVIVEIEEPNKKPTQIC